MCEYSVISRQIKMAKDQMPNTDSSRFRKACSLLLKC